MQELTEAGAKMVAQIADESGLSRAAVSELARALAAGGGTQAQFNHSELGGMGQWSQGGMVMVGDMFNNALKASVDQVCSRLASEMAATPAFRRPVAAPAGTQSQSQSQGGAAGTSFSVSGGFASSGWPPELGSPSSTGSQNNLRYAVFPQTRRLAIDVGGRIEVFDIGDHQISGFSQQQSGDQSITFTSQFGLVRVADLPRVKLSAASASATAAPPASGQSQPQPAPKSEAVTSGATETAQAEPKKAEAAKPESAASPKKAAEAPVSAAVPASSAPASASGGIDDVVAAIEKLGTLRDKGLLSDEEFAAKKTELLSRL